MAQIILAFDSGVSAFELDVGCSTRAAGDNDIFLLAINGELEPAASFAIPFFNCIRELNITFTSQFCEDIAT